MPKPILCPCGTEKFYLNGVMACAHCGAAAAGQRCACCVTYSLSVNNRVAVEYAAERSLRRRNGC